MVIVGVVRSMEPPLEIFYLSYLKEAAEAVAKMGTGRILPG